jgi:hypothetical protein
VYVDVLVSEGSFSDCHASGFACLCKRPELSARIHTLSPSATAAVQCTNILYKQKKQMPFKTSNFFQITEYVGVIKFRGKVALSNAENINLIVYAFVGSCDWTGFMQQRSDLIRLQLIYILNITDIDYFLLN